MHLSLLSDAYLSDSLADSGAATVGSGPAAPDHRAPLLRGLAVVAVFAALMGLTVLCGTVPCAEAAKTLRAPTPSTPALSLKTTHRIATP